MSNKIGIIGLGYVGLPLARLLATKKLLSMVVAIPGIRDLMAKESAAVKFN